MSASKAAPESGSLTLLEDAILGRIAAFARLLRHHDLPEPGELGPPVGENTCY